MSTPVPGVLSRRSHRRCARIRCAPPVARNATHSSHGAQEAHLHAEHDAPDHGHGRDQAVPGPADSLEGRQASRLPGKHSVFPHLTGAEQNASYTGTAVEFTERHTFTRHGKAWGAAHTGPGIRFICDSDAIAPMLPLRLRHPRARPARRPPATPPTHPPPTRSVASTCRCSSVPVFWETRHMLQHE